MSGGARNRFDGQRWIENIIKERTREALERFPARERYLTTIRSTSGKKSYINKNAPKGIASEKNATNSGTSVEPKQELKTLPKRRQQINPKLSFQRLANERRCDGCQKVKVKSSFRAQVAAFAPIFGWTKR